MFVRFMRFFTRTATQVAKDTTSALEIPESSHENILNLAKSYNIVECRRLLYHLTISGNESYLDLLETVIARTSTKGDFWSLCNFIISYGVTGKGSPVIWNTFLNTFLMRKERGFERKNSEAIMYLIKNCALSDLSTQALYKIITESNFDALSHSDFIINAHKSSKHEMKELLLGRIMNYDYNSEDSIRFIWTLHKMKEFPQELFDKLSKNVGKIYDCKDVVMFVQGICYSPFKKEDLKNHMYAQINNIIHFLSLREISNILHAVSGSPFYSESETTENLIELATKFSEINKNLMDFSSILHSMKKLNKSPERFIPFINDSLLKRCSGTELATIIFSMESCLTAELLEKFKFYTLKNVGKMHSKSVLNLAVLFSATDVFDREFWDRFEPSFEKAMKSFDFKRKTDTALKQYKTVLMRVKRLK